jgi:hypothetical protein
MQGRCIDAGPALPVPGAVKRKEILLRIAPDLWEEVARWAADEFRSVNGHIEFLLRDAVRTKRGRVPKRAPAEGGTRKESA